MANHLSRRPEYQALVQDFEDYEAGEIESVTLKKENCAKRR